MLRTMIARPLAAFAAAGLMAAAALAADKPLTEKQAKDFVKTLDAVQEIADGRDDEFDIDMQPKAGAPFQPYTTAVETLKKDYPADHARLANAVRPHGFSTAEWGAVGDRVMVAYLALRMQEEDPRAMKMMEGMDGSMLAQMPPEMRSQLEGVMAMMETVKNAPEADKQVVAAVKPELDAFMERQGGS